MERTDIDETHVLEREYGPCKVRVMFRRQQNEQVIRNVLDSLMHTFDSRNTAENS